MVNEVSRKIQWCSRRYRARLNLWHSTLVVRGVCVISRTATPTPESGHTLLSVFSVHYHVYSTAHKNSWKCTVHQYLFQSLRGVFPNFTWTSDSCTADACLAETSLFNIHAVSHIVQRKSSLCWLCTSCYSLATGAKYKLPTTTLSNNKEGYAWCWCCHTNNVSWGIGVYRELFMVLCIVLKMLI